MKNVIIGVFAEESKTYQTLSELKTRAGSSVVLTAGIVKNENGHLQVKDGYNFDDYGSNWATGGLLGSLIGILGGPVGVLAGGSLGTLIGTGVDADSIGDSVSIVHKIGSKIDNYQLGLMLIVDEPTTHELDHFLYDHGCSTIIRESYVDVQTEIYQAQELEEHLAKEAKKKLREEKKEKWRSKAEARQQELQEKIDQFKEKLSER